MDKFILGFGEVMLRLSPEGCNRLGQALPGSLCATFGGGEANVTASLAILGAKARYSTALSDNPVSTAFATQFRGLGVDVSAIHYTRLGRSTSGISQQNDAEVDIWKTPAPNCLEYWLD